MPLTEQLFEDLCNESPVITAVKDMQSLEQSKSIESKMVYILFGDICNIGDIVSTVKASGKHAIVHVDLISGFSTKEVCVDFMKQHTSADGIISSKPYLIKRARELELFTIQRFWMMDAITYANVVKYAKTISPNIVDLMPAGLTKVIRYLTEEITQPIVASGLVLDKEDVYGALSAGAIAVSTTNQGLWI